MAGHCGHQHSHDRKDNLDGFHFSWIGALFLMALVVPNLLWTRARPKGYSTKGENRVLVALERAGEVLASITVTTAAGLRPMPWSGRAWLLIGAICLMALYELWWIRYFKSARSMGTFYEPLGFIPIPGAILPVAAFLLLGAYARDPWLVIATVILGIGHIGVHAQHAMALRCEEA